MNDLVKRINELADLQKKGLLTEELKEEQARLRKEYVERIKASLKAQLDSIEFTD